MTDQTLDKTTLIIGAGHAGVQAAASLREYGWQGQIALINDEDRLPYERPPLSKTFDGEKAIVPLRPQAFFDDKRIDLKMGSAVVSIDADAQSLSLSDGSTLTYDNCIVCTGSGPLRVPPFADPDMDGVYVLRNAPHEAAMRAAIDAGNLRRLLVIGAGFIGLETAAALAERLDAITVVDLAPSAMGRGVAPEIGQLCVDALQKAGVEVHFETKVESIATTDDGLEITLTGGKTLTVDGVLLSVGARPNDDLLVNAGLGEHRAIAVDTNCQVPGTKGLYAVGDMVMAPHPLLGDQPVRLESVDVAVLQAKTAAAAICGAAEPRVQAPWFWSPRAKQMQMGIKGMATQWVIRQIMADVPTATALGFNDDNQLMAAQCLNNPKDFAASRKFWAPRLPGYSRPWQTRAYRRRKPAR